MVIFVIIVIGVILLAIFLATTIAGGRYHDEQKAIRDRAEAARAARLRQEASADLDRKPLRPCAIETRCSRSVLR
jgi:hypothetical protein